MSIETEFFEIPQIEWQYQKSHGISSNRNPQKPIRVGVAAMSVRCKKCGAEWRAIRGRNHGQFTEVTGAVRIICLSCATESAVSNQLLKQLWINGPTMGWRGR